MPRDRAQTLRALIAYELPIESVITDLSRFGWDATEPLVVLTRQDILAVLDRYLAGDLTSEQVTDWADLVECREDIALPDGEKDLLSDVIFRLANPYLRDEVTPELGQRIRRELTDARRTS
jgi:hypothetical protein